MDDTNLQDDLVFDRLVDGELSAAERHVLLASLDDRPDGWRRCALVFLEAQCWTEGLGQFVRAPVDEAVQEKRSSQVVVSRGVGIGKPTRHGVAWLAMAASLLVAFTLGLLWRNNQAPIANQVGQTSDSQMANVIPPPAVPNAGRVDDALTLWVRDEHGQARPVQVPLVDAGALDQQLGLQFQSGVPADVRSHLQDRGFDVQSKRRYAPLWLENGRPMIVPVEDTKIVPVSRDVY
jgi:hypothetical protein